MVRASAVAVVAEGVVEMPESRRGTPISVRVPPDLAKRLDRLVPRVSKDKSFSTLGIITRSSIIKLALLRGVEALEAEYK